jgi:hypothetical protein
VLEKINEPVSVIATFSCSRQGVVRVMPYAISWRGKRYRVETFGLYHPERRGTKKVHIFSFSSGSVAFRVELDPDTLGWRLVEVYYEN